MFMLIRRLIIIVVSIYCCSCLSSYILLIFSRIFSPIFLLIDVNQRLLPRVSTNNLPDRLVSGKVFNCAGFPGYFRRFLFGRPKSSLRLLYVLINSRILAKHGVSFHQLIGDVFRLARVNHLAG